jgi:bacterial/archaeal transporter family-2 protein
MHTIIFALLAVGAGACIALQASANGNFRRNLGDNALFAATFSILGTVLTATVAMLILRPQVPSAAALRETPWWNWIGGPLGALIVLAGAALTARLGAALFIALVVGGQLLCSLVLDHFALMGLNEQPVTLGRILGATLVVTGVLCIKYL